MAKRGRPKKRQIKLGLKKETVLSIIAILLLIFAALIMLSFSRRVPVLRQLNDFLHNLFGVAAFVVPFLLFVLSALFSRLKTPLTRYNVLFGSFLFFISLLGIGRLGTVGQFLFHRLADLISLAGAFLIYLSGVVIGLLVLFDASLEQIAEKIKIGAEKVRQLLSFEWLKSRGEGEDSVYVGEKRRQKTKPEKESVPAEKKKKKEPSTSKRKVKQMPELETEDDSAAIDVPGATQKVWQYPPLSLLDDGGSEEADRGDVNENADTIEETLGSFGIKARVQEVNPGPAVTQYGIEVALGTKLSKITSLANDLALALAAPTGQIRIEAPIPGRSLAGIELPNRSLEIVHLKQMLASSQMKKTESKLSVALGRGVSGEPQIIDVAKMPHVLIAGQTGSGKSVLLNSWIASWLFRTTPEEVKLILIDPKRVEFSLYEGVPHLKSSIIVEPKKVVSALEWAIGEMEDRYKKFAEAGVRNIQSYNQKSGFASLPYLVIVIDELADIMLYAPSEVEERICRLAQMARATGIHLVIATQRPSVDILTGLIKANIPCRISCAVSSSVDSRVILDTPGAEKLLGRGDMLYLPPDRAKPLRIQGSFISEKEVKRLIKFLKKTGVEPVYTDEVVETPVQRDGRGAVRVGEDRDELFDEAIEVIYKRDRASASLLQRRLRIGYTRAARILDQLHAAGIVGAQEGSKPREMLAETKEQARQLAAEGTMESGEK